MARTPAFRQGEDAFRIRAWKAAIGAFRPEWRRGNRQFRVAYYIGASHCNLRQYPDGKAWLAHALSRMRPPAPTSDIIANALSNCSDGGPPLMRWISTSEWSRTAEIMYFGSNRRLRFTAIDGSNAVPGAVLAQRLVSADDRRGIAETAQKLRDALDRPPADDAANCARGGPVITQAEGRFLFVTRVGTAPFVLRAWGEALEAYVQSIQVRLGVPVPGKTITVHLARCSEDAVAIALEVHGLRFDPQAIAGYSVQEDLSLLAIWHGYMPGEIGKQDSQAMRTIRHELFHLMLHEWFGDAPAWLDEGIAQYLGVTGGGPGPARETVLHSSWGPLPKLADVIEPRSDATIVGCLPVAQQMMSADVARMTIAYLDQTPGRLRRLIETMRSYEPSAGVVRSDRQLLEKAVGHSIPELEAAYRKASVVRVDDSLFQDVTGADCPT